jgi:L-glyceraldehyde 3-phosphate reductase
MLPAISLGLWQSFGARACEETSRQVLWAAWTGGITHFDLANNYGPPPGSAEEGFGRFLRRDFRSHRDRMILSTKAGYRMWPGPYGDGGSRKYLIASLNASLRRLGTEYVDIFYHHRPDPETPLEETMGALASIVQNGKALYVGLSNYGAEEASRALALLRGMGVPCLIHQPKYNLLSRAPEQALFPLLEKEGIGVMAFSPLAQGVLAGRYLTDIPFDSRAGRGSPFLSPEKIETDTKLRNLVSRFARLAAESGRTPAQMALAWVLRLPFVTSALIGASRPSQVKECCSSLEAGPLTDSDLESLENLFPASGI